MRWQGKLAVVAVAVIAGMANHPLRELENILRPKSC
jgi:hypothetical protein